MDTATITTIFSILGVLSAGILGWTAKSRSVKQDVAADASRETRLQTDMEYIKRGIDDMRVDLRLQGDQYDQLAERVTRVEESSKQAHRRLDRAEGKQN